MKKPDIIIAAIAALLALLWLVGSRTQFEVPEGFELGADTPADLVRTIYNLVFDDTATFKRFSHYCMPYASERVTNSKMSCIFDE